jgi:outer membrane protein assembly factor BamB
VGQLLVALDPFENGDTQPATAYTRNKNLPYVPVPVCHGDHVYLWNDNGVVNCMETLTGNNVWTKRIGGKFTGSPICVDGTLYIMSEEGKVVVLAASPEFQQYGEMPLGDPSHSTPAFANGRLYLRTFHRLACLESHP